MYLDQLLSDCNVISPIPKIDIKNIAYHHKDVTNDFTAFFYFQAFLNYHNWEEVISKGIKNGASILVLDASDVFYDYLDIVEKFQDQIKIVVVVELYKNISSISSKFFNYPSRRLKIITATGTNGKTSVVHITAQTLNKLGYKAAIISSLGYGIITEPLVSDAYTGLRTGYTTPPAVELFRILSLFVSMKVDIAVIEVTSHALEWGTISALNPEVAIFTNISDDHLEYHGSFLSYANAKKRLFNIEEFKNIKSFIINRDDKVGRTIIRELLAKNQNVIEYSSSKPISLQNNQNVTAENILQNLKGTIFDVRYGDQVAHCATPFLGSFYIPNLLAVIGCLLSLKFELEEITGALKHATRVPGRMEVLNKENLPTVIVDFAHNPDGIEKCIKSIRDIAKERKIYLVFGISDLVTTDYRENIIKILCKYLDNVIITATNTYHSDPEIVIDNFASCFPKNFNFIKIYDRKEAINYGITRASSEDIILIIGKGIEKYLFKQNDIIDHSDMEYVSSIYKN